MLEDCGGGKSFVFRINDTGNGPQLLTQVCLERGWREYDLEGEVWNLWWKTSGFSINNHKNLNSLQFLNHIPNGSSICRKDNLIRFLRCMKNAYGSIYDFSPDAYNLPLEYTKLAAEHNRSKSSTERSSLETALKEECVWICKPAAQSQGKGIFLFRQLSDLTYDTNAIVQRYIETPLLIGGYKFDLRLYVCVPCYHPLTIYAYKEGLARFGTDKFNLHDLRNPFRHLTNSSINKLGPGYMETKDRIGQGCKWTLKQLRRYFHRAKIEDWLLWKKISSLIILTLFSHVSHIPPTVNCFEFFGFDVLIDSSLKPWLLEVNLSPALGNDCDTDKAVKKPMLHDLFDLLGFPLYNTGLAVYNVWLNNANDKDLTSNSCVRKIQATSTVLKAAGRWRTKHKRAYARCNSQSALEESKIKTKSGWYDRDYLNISAVTPLFGGSVSRKLLNDVAVNLSKKSINLTATGSEYINAKKHLTDVNANETWGNGKDWACAPQREGGWVRLWPMKNKTYANNIEFGRDENMKDMIGQVAAFNKVCKDLYKKYPGAPESQLNFELQDRVGLTTDIWMPDV